MVSQIFVIIITISEFGSAYYIIDLILLCFSIVLEDKSDVVVYILNLSFLCENHSLVPVLHQHSVLVIVHLLSTMNPALHSISLH